MNRLAYAIGCPVVMAIFSLPVGGPMSQDITLAFNAAKIGAWVALAITAYRLVKFTLCWMQETTIFLAETRATTHVVREKHPEDWDGKFTEQMATKQARKDRAKGMSA